MGYFSGINTRDYGSKYLTINGERYKLIQRFSTQVKAEVEANFLKTAPHPFRINFYRIIRAKITIPVKDRRKEFKKLTYAYDLYGR